MLKELSIKKSTSKICKSNLDNPKRRKRSYNDKEKQKAIAIVSTQEDYKIQSSFGCKIIMLVGYGEDGKMNTTIITTKEEVDYQFWYPGRNKVIKEYKYINNKYSWEK